MKIIVCCLTIVCFVTGGFLVIGTPLSAQDERGLTIGGAKTITDTQGKEVLLYQESHALVIGVSSYTGGWVRLPGVKKDVEAIKAALEAHGFNVVVKMDLKKNALIQAFDEFIHQYGHAPENRLLFYFAGHGYTSRLAYGGEMGYVVPTDAPLPEQDKREFLSKALDMQMIEVYAKRIQAKHALFLFDSCFSGSLFSISRASPEHISDKTAKPVRQFITSGSADETVPDESIFRQQFIAALDGEGDLNEDGYVTGSELGLFLEDTVINYSNGTQHPQYGKIRDRNLDQGDFVFQLPGAIYIEQIIITESPEAPSSLDPEAEMWELVKNSNDISDVRYFLKKFPQGRLTEVAQLKLKQLERQLTPTPRPTPTLMPRPTATPTPQPISPPTIRLRSTPMTTDSKEKVVGRMRKNDKWVHIPNDFEDQGDVVFDRATGLTWQKTDSKNYMTYDGARAYCEKLNLAGKNDWRLPTVEELASLLEEKKNSAGYYIDPIFNVNISWYWSIDKRSSMTAWFVDFGFGRVRWLDVGRGDGVRCVRSGQ